MTRRRWIVLGILVGGLGLIQALAGPGNAQAPGANGGPSLQKRLAKKWGISEQEVGKRLQDLGQEVEQELGGGRTVDVPGLGTLRVVSVMPFRQTREGRPVLVEMNNVQLVPAAPLTAAANSPGARPVAQVLPSDYFYQDFPYGGAAIDRVTPLTTGSGRDLNPSNKPSQKIGGSRRP